MKAIKSTYKITIRNKLLLYFSLLILMTVVAQLIFNFLIAEEIYALYKQNYMESAYYKIQEAYDGDNGTIEALVNDIEDTENIQITITSDGDLIYITTAEVEERDPTEELEESVLSPDGMMLKPQVNENTLLTISEDVIQLVESFEYEGETIVVRMALPLASIESTASFFTNSNIVIGVLVLVFGVLLALRLSKGITKPIEDIEKISHNLSNLEFEEYASEDNGTKEIASLGQSINRMSKELEIRIEELNEANAKLKKDVDYQLQAEQMRKEFVANVSHEMKTPLAILQFYCENLKSDIEGIDKTYYLETIIEETQRMDEMVKSMLEISSLENGLDKMQFEKMNLSEVTDHTVEKLQPLLQKYQVSIDIDEEQMVIGDSRYLEQAMSNYITNAVSHTKEGEEVRIALKQCGSKVRCSVYNQGNSINEVHAERIWESFYKSDKSRVRKDHSNVGLGLHIVKCIIENHKGFYGVESVEQGVEFWFEIPLMNES